jgi:hypothetical protein
MSFRGNGYASNNRGIVGNDVFIRPAQSGYKEELVENSKSSSGAPSEQSAESWVLQGTYRRWRYEYSWSRAMKRRLYVCCSAV